MKIELSFSKKRFSSAIIFAAVILALAIYFASTAKFMVCVTFIFVVAGSFKIKLSGNGHVLNLIHIGFMVLAAAVTVVLMQKTNDITFFQSFELFLLNMSIALLLVSIAVGIETLVKEKPGAVAIIGPTFSLMVFSLANYFLYSFRGNALSPADFMTLGTAVNFVGEYEYEITRFIFNGFALYIAAAFCFTGIEIEAENSRKARGVSLTVMILLLAAILHKPIFSGAIPSQHYRNDGLRLNGLLLNFVLETKESFINKPEAYSIDWLALAEEKYGKDEVDTAPELSPNIIVIMNESFCDIRVFGEYETDIPVMPFFDSLNENTIKGYALSSVYGGMTANSEFEFLTGNTMGFLPAFTVPFQQYISAPVYTLVHYLESLGYSSFATHPHYEENWSRYKIYPYLGFDDYAFIEAYEGVETYNEFVSDRGLYNFVIDKYNSMIQQDKKFIYAVTMQNHGPYDFYPNGAPEVTVKGCDDVVINEFMSRIHRSDQALQELIAYFEQVDEPVVILMFGDHQASLPSEFLEQLQLNSKQAVDEQFTRYIVPFVVWANYDIEEQEIELTSLNYLSNYLLEAAGLPFSAYNHFLSEVSRYIPAINALGYYSVEKDGFISNKDAEGKEKEILQEYSRLQYNAMFDKNNRSTALFPTTN